MHSAVVVRVEWSVVTEFESAPVCCNGVTDVSCRVECGSDESPEISFLDHVSRQIWEDFPKYTFVTDRVLRHARDVLTRSELRQ